MKGLVDKSMGIVTRIVERLWLELKKVVYYESVKRELKIRCIYECRLRLFICSRIKKGPHFL